MKRTALILMLALLCSVASAKRYSYVTWTFEVPDNAVESRRDGIYGYKVGGTSYLFTPPAPSNGRTPEQLAQNVINDVVGNQEKVVNLVVKRDWDDGELIVYSVFTMTTAGPQHQVFQVFTLDDQWGLLLTTLPVGSGDTEMDAALTVLKTVEFAPPAQAKQAGGASTTIASALPNLPWPTTRADRVIVNKAKVEFPAARKMGLDPYSDLLPDAFDCYRVTGSESLRAMNPTPDVRVSFAQGGAYSASDGRATQSGRWLMFKDGNSRYLKLTGPLEDDRIYVNGDERGQRFVAYWLERKVVCLQQGPRADSLRVDMARARIGNETFNCVEKDGKPYPLKLANGTYSTPRGNGRLRSGFKLEDRADVEAVLTFTGGPYDSNDGKISEDDAGNRILDIQYSVSKGGAFSRETTTITVARCTAKTTPKPQALYGPAKAPATSQKGGPDGYYVGYRQYTSFVGQIPMPSYALQLSYFTPTGYFIDDLEPDETGVLPDCTRTLPNGDPYCQRYEIKGKTIRTQGSNGKWYGPDDYSLTKDELKFDNTTLYRVSPLKAMPTGIFTSDDLKASGMPGSAGSGNISNYANAYQFNGGQFVWRLDSSSTTTVGNPGFQPGIMASASSSRSDNGNGKYALNGYWLTLTFTDGRVRRLFTYPRPAALVLDDDPRVKALSIGGTWLNRAK